MSHFSPTDWESFWVSFWAGLWSGAIYSVVTGLLVGVIIWRITVKSENRYVSRKCDREISVFKSQLQFLYTKPNTIMINSSLVEMLPEPILSVKKALNDVPLDTWIDETRTHKELVMALKAFRDSYLRYSSAAETIDAIFVSTVRRKLAEDGAPPPYNDQMRLTWLRGRLCGFTQEDIVPFVKVTKDHNPNFDALLDEIMSSDELKEKRADFDDARQTLFNVFESLNESSSL